MTTVQWVYLAVALLGVSVIIAFVFTDLPEVTEEELQSMAAEEAEVSGGETEGDKNFWRTKAVFGFVAQFCYVGAQVTIGSFFIVSPIIPSPLSPPHWDWFLTRFAAISTELLLRGRYLRLGRLQPPLLRSHHLHRRSIHRYRYPLRRLRSSPVVRLLDRVLCFDGGYLGAEGDGWCYLLDHYHVLRV